MELSRRDALVALATTGVVSGNIGAVVAEHEEKQGNGKGDSKGPVAHVPTLFSLAEVLYPSDVDITEEFVKTYVVGRSVEDEAYHEEMAAATAYLDEQARERQGKPFVALSMDARDTLLRELGLHEVDSDPEGTRHEKVRYYLINELLYALLTTPEGGSLIGLENPPGYPGGLQSYQGGSYP
jgi:hypothetical protein